MRFSILSAKRRSPICCRSDSGRPRNASVARRLRSATVARRLRNASVADGTTLHWHGVAVPFDQDGVAGGSQDAVPPGQDFVYRFVVARSGTYWYHSHQVAHAQVRGGLLGALGKPYAALVACVDPGLAEDANCGALTGAVR